MSDLKQETLKLKRWAVVGAREDPATYGYKIFRLLHDRGYDVTPIHPKLEEIDGVKVVASITAMTPPPEVVDMVVNPSIGLAVMQEIADAGIKFVWLQPGARSDEIRAFAADNAIELIEDCVLVRLG